MMANLLLVSNAVERAALKIEGKGLAVIEDMTAVLTLTDKGMIRECNDAVGRLFGCDPSQLIWQHVSAFLPQLAEIMLLQGEQINPRLSFLSRIGHHFEAIGPAGASFVSELFFHIVENPGRRHLRVIIRPVYAC
jgi:PAS domain-containing protein